MGASDATQGSKASDTPARNDENDSKKVVDSLDGISFVEPVGVKFTVADFQCVAVPQIQLANRLRGFRSTGS